MEFAAIRISPVTYVDTPVSLVVEATPPEYLLPVTYITFYCLNQLLNPILFSWPIMYIFYFHDIMIPHPTGFSAYYRVLYIWIFSSDFKISRRSENPRRWFIHYNHRSYWFIDHPVRYIDSNYREQEGICTRPHSSFCLSAILVSI